VKGERGSVSVVIAAVVLLALVLSLGVADVAQVLVARSRARTAADAAALAVAQDLAVPSGADLTGLASYYAGQNGATLTNCTCEAGQLETTVGVSITVRGFLLVAGDRTVTARARAVVDLPSASPSPVVGDLPGFLTETTEG
jgi:secretion/DNA translocation related TadE-like protein